jgi:hypothetical protein
MSWISLANNQTVSFNNLQNAVNNGVFTPTSTSIPASNEQITKADAPIYVNINTAFASYAAKASNQLLVKSNLDPVITSYSHIIYYSNTCFYDGFFIEQGAGSAANACDLTTSITLYSADFALGNGSVLYFDSGLTNQWYSDGLCGEGLGYFLTSGYSFRYDDDIQDYTVCAGSTAYMFGNCGKGSSPANACSDAVSNARVFYSECQFLTVGCSLFIGSNLTSPVTDLYTFADASWDMDGFGLIIGFSPVQC